MTTPLRLLALAVLASSLLPLCRADGERAPATVLEALPTPVSLSSVEVMESDPPRFALALQIEMGHPGWEIEVADVGRPDPDGRILVHLRLLEKDGIWPAVMTPIPVRVALGSLEEGTYVVDLVDVGQGPGRRRAIGALVLRARS